MSEVTKEKLKARPEFIEFIGFKTSTEGSTKRIRLNTIEEYYLCANGRLTVFHSGKKSVFEYKDKKYNEKMLSDLDSMFNLIKI